MAEDGPSCWLTNTEGLADQAGAWSECDTAFHVCLSTPCPPPFLDFSLACPPHFLDFSLAFHHLSLIFHCLSTACP